MTISDDDLDALIRLQLELLAIDASAADPGAIRTHLRNFAALHGTVGETAAELPIDPLGIYRP